MPDIFLYAGEPNPNDIRLSDPTQLRGGGVSFTLSCESGSFALSGANASVSISRIVQFSSGGFTLAGGDVQIQIARQIQLSNGSFSLAGGVMQTLFARSVSLSSASFNLSGQPVGFVAARTITASTGAFDLIGASVVIIPSGQPVPPVPPTPISGGASYSGERKRRKTIRVPTQMMQRREVAKPKSAPAVEYQIIPDVTHIPSGAGFQTPEILVQNLVFNPTVPVDDEDSDMAVAIAVLEMY